MAAVQFVVSLTSTFAIIDRAMLGDHNIYDVCALSLAVPPSASTVTGRVEDAFYGFAVV